MQIYAIYPKVPNFREEIMRIFPKIAHFSFKMMRYFGAKGDFPCFSLNKIPK